YWSVRARCTAAYASTMPYPSKSFGTAFGSPQTILPNDTPPRCAVSRKICSVVSILPINLGFADHISATTPTMCGPAIEVPDNAPYVPPGSAEFTPTPGAAISGLTRPLLSANTGPRLENEARRLLRSIAPTENTSPYKAMGLRMVLQSGPSFPAEATTNTPASRKARTAGNNTFASQPSSSGQPHELFKTIAPRVASPSRSGSPFWG